jgi:hypothetical protein
MPQHTFIVVTNQGQSQREYELQRSIARAHAASVSYHNGRDPAKKVTIRQVDHRPTVRGVLTLERGRQTKRIAGQQKAAEDKSLPEEAIQRSVKDSAWRWINGTSTDPFDIIPGSNKGAAPYALEFCE